MKKIIFGVLVILLISSVSRAGIIFDDPVELRTQPITHWFSSDEINFKLVGKCEPIIFNDVELTLTLKYANGTKTVYASRKIWCRTAPLSIEVPSGLANLESYTLTGKFSSAWEPNGYIPKNNGDKEHDTKELAKAFKAVTGYKIDSTFSVQ